MMIDELFDMKVRDLFYVIIVEINFMININNFIYFF